MHRQNQDDTLQQFNDVILRFSGLAYPTVQGDVPDDMAIGTFNEGVLDMELLQYLMLFKAESMVGTPESTLQSVALPGALGFVGTPELYISSR